MDVQLNRENTRKICDIALISPYVMHLITHNEQGLTIHVAADFDLTGQMVWPGAELLNDYLSKNSDMLRGCSVIELGSGVG